MTLSAFATITPKPHHFDDAKAAIEGILADTRAEEGCLRFDLHSGHDDEGERDHRLYLYEVWADRAAFDRHHAMPYTRAVYRRYEDWLAAPVEITFMQPVA